MNREKQNTYTALQYVKEIAKREEEQGKKEFVLKKNYQKSFFDSFDPLLRRGRDLAPVFSDFLSLTVYAFAFRQKAKEFEEVLFSYNDEDVLHFINIYLALTQGMEITGEDILGDFFEEHISHGRNGQFFSPDSVGNLMAMILNSPIETDFRENLWINDPACGSGKLLISQLRKTPNALFVGVDKEANCAKMAIINLALWQKHGIIVCGDSIKVEQYFVYEVGLVQGGGLVRELDPLGRNYIIPHHPLMDQTGKKPSSKTPFPPHSRSGQVPQNNIVKEESLASKECVDKEETSLLKELCSQEEIVLENMEIVPEENFSEETSSEENLSKENLSKENTFEEVFDSFGNCSPYDNSHLKKSVACVTGEEDEKLDQLAF